MMATSAGARTHSAGAAAPNTCENASTCAMCVRVMRAWVRGVRAGPVVVPVWFEYDRLAPWRQAQTEGPKLDGPIGPAVHVLIAKLKTVPIHAYACRSPLTNTELPTSTDLPEPLSPVMTFSPGPSRTVCSVTNAKSRMYSFSSRVASPPPMTAVLLPPPPALTLLLLLLPLLVLPAMVLGRDGCCSCGAGGAGIAEGGGGGERCHSVGRVGGRGFWRELATEADAEACGAEAEAVAPVVIIRDSSRPGRPPPPVPLLLPPLLLPPLLLPPLLLPPPALAPSPLPCASGPVAERNADAGVEAEPPRRLLEPEPELEAVAAAVEVDDPW